VFFTCPLNPPPRESLGSTAILSEVVYNYGQNFKGETMNDLSQAIWSSILSYQLIILPITAASETKKYNHNLYRDIFGKEPPSFTLNLLPTYQGASLTLAYKFD
jgi:hypothetical protein